MGVRCRATSVAKNDHIGKGLQFTTMRILKVNWGGFLRLWEVTSTTPDDSCCVAYRSHIIIRGGRYLAPPLTMTAAAWQLQLAASAPNTERHNGLLFTGDVTGKAWPAIRTSGEACYQSGCLLTCQTWSLLQWNCFIVYPTNQTLKEKCGRRDSDWKPTWTPYLLSECLLWRAF